MTSHSHAARAAPTRAAPTRAAQAGIGRDALANSVAPPLYLTSTYTVPGYLETPPFDYGRGANPTRDTLADALADLEGGAGATVTSSGMSALELVTNLVPTTSETGPGRIVAPHDCYGGTHRLLTHRHRQGRYQVAFVDQHDPDAFRAACEGAQLVLVETPSNPLMRLYDIARLAEIAHAAGAKVMVDNTFLSPARQLPLSLGADFSVHSTTKSIAGHSDVVGGAVVSASADDAEAMRWWANCTGVTAGAFDSWLVLRGLRTLFVRMDAAEANAARIADWLTARPEVTSLYFPGHNAHSDLVGTQQSGPGSVLSFELVPGGAKAVLESTKLLQPAPSLGGVESLICHPASMTHKGMEPAARRQAGLGDDLMRVSVGVESGDDLLADLEQAFGMIPN